MDRVLRVIAPVVFSLMLVVTACSPAPAAGVGDQAPDFQLQNLDGQTVSLSELRGGPVLLNFWATWCPPCRSEMPYLEQIYQEWSDRGLALLAVNVGESPSQVRDFMQEYNLSLPVLLDINEKVARRYNVTGYPTTFFIDKDGIIQEAVLGAFPNKESIELYLDKIIP